MRATVLSTMFAPALALVVSAAPAAAQVHVGVHFDLPGHAAPVYRPAPPPRFVNVLQYSARAFGNWRDEARSWQPVTLYLWQGRYYYEPIGYAQPVVVYSYRGQYFFEPRDRDWISYRERYLQNDYRRDDHDYRDRDTRDDHDYRNYRDDRGDHKVIVPQRGNDVRARPRTGGL